MDAEGMEVLLWLRSHYLLHEGKWDFEPGSEGLTGPGETEESYAAASIVIAKGGITLRKEASAIKAEALIAATKEVNKKPPPHLTHIGNGVHLPTAAVKASSAKIYDFTLFRKERKKPHGTSRTP
jgi:hypothetical protein